MTVLDVFDTTAQLVLLKVLSVTLFDCRTCHKRGRARQNISHSDGLDYTEEYSGVQHLNWNVFSRSVVRQCKAAFSLGQNSMHLWAAFEG